MDVKVISGSISLDGTWFGDGLPAPANGTATGHWEVDDVPVSGDIVGPPFTFVGNTTGIPDGTHVISMVFTDGAVTPAAPSGPYSLRSRYLMAIIQNSGPINGAQLLPSVPLGFNDRIDPTRLDFVHYTGVANPDNTVHAYPTEVIAPSSDPSWRPLIQWYVEGTTVIRYGEYMAAQRFATTQQGGVFIQGYNFQDAITLEAVYDRAILSPLYDGGRGNNSVSPYCNWIANPQGDWTGVDVSGRVFRIEHNGNVTTIAGPQRIRSVLPYDMYDLTVTEDQIAAKETIIGTISGFGDFGGANDLCYDPRNSNILYVAKTLDHCIIKIDFSFNPPHATLYAGQDGVSGYVEGSAIGQALFNEPYSIIMDPTGIMYVADCFNSAIRKITAGGVVSTVVGVQPVPSVATVAAAVTADPDGNIYSPKASQAFASVYTAYPQTIRFTSSGNIVLGEAITGAVRLINLGASTVHRIGAFGDLVYGDPNRDWTWLDVDTVGAAGPVDDIIVIASDRSPGSAAVIWRLSLDGTYTAVQGNGGGYLPEGRANIGAFGDGFHYPWAIAISKTQGRFLTNGFGHTGVGSWRFLQPGDPPYDFGNEIGWDPVYVKGNDIWETGTCACFPWNSRPSFIVSGGGPYGGGDFVGAPSFDDLQASYPTDAALAAYLQAGGFGTVPRPEITGNDMRNLIYFIRRSSLSGSWPTTVVPGPTNPDVTQPLISSVAAVRLSPTSIRVSWNTDKSTIGIAGAGSQNVYVAAPPCFSSIESTFGLTHTVVITGLPTTTPIHYGVLAKDVAGNTSASSDMTIA